MTVPTGFLAAVVERRLDVTDDLAVFWLRPSAPLTFLPGQYVTLAVPGAGGRPVKRAYSVVSAPHEPFVELVVERVAGGALTPVLWDRAEGDAVWVREKVVGHFLLDAERLRHVMACTVTGVAPFLSMIRAHIAASVEAPDHRFLVLHGASRAREFGPYLDEGLALTEASQGRVVYVPTVSRPWADAAWTGEVGRVEDVARKYLDRLGWGADAAGYACGNPGMVETVKGLLQRARLEAAHVHEEKYFTDTAEPASPPPQAPPPLPASPPRRAPRLPGDVPLRAVSRPDDQVT